MRMIEMKKIFLLLSLLLGAVPVTFSQIKVQWLNPANPISGSGIIYNLPLTGFTVELDVVKTEQIKGPYSEFAEKYLGLTDVIRIDNTVHYLATASVTAFESADPNAYYLISTVPVSKRKGETNIYLTKEGFLAGASSLQYAEQKAKDDFQQYETSKGIPEIITSGYYEKIDTITRRTGRDTLLIEELILKRNSTAKTPDQKAKEAADFIMKLDESMFNLINGYQEVNYEKGTMEFMYREMERMREQYLLQFKGITRTTTQKFTYQVIPERGKKFSEYPIARFSIMKGIMDKSVTSGDIISLEVNDLNNLPALNYQKKTEDTESASGIVYRTPDNAEINVKLGGKVILRSQFPVSQLGELMSLPPDNYNDIEFHDKTGSVKKVTIK